jgi:broad specificity phosphatase PhoE
MTRWHWVRHGPTHETSFVGWRDVAADLSDTAMIARLDAALPRDAIIVSSDLIRCIATANAIEKGRARLPHAAAIRELHFGIWDGMKFDAVAERDPILSRQYWEEPGDIRAPNGESWNDARARIQPFVDQMNVDYPDRDIIAVAHFGTILTQVQTALGCTAYDSFSHKIDNLSVTELHFSGHWTAQKINHIP